MLLYGLHTVQVYKHGSLRMTARMDGWVRDRSINEKHCTPWARDFFSSATSMKIHVLRSQSIEGEEALLSVGDTDLPLLRAQGICASEGPLSKTFTL